jgi:hypothetical protein
MEMAVVCGGVKLWSCEMAVDLFVDLFLIHLCLKLSITMYSVCVAAVHECILLLDAWGVGTGVPVHPYYYV